jgi:hypothetical protein
MRIKQWMKNKLIRSVFLALIPSLLFLALLGIVFFIQKPLEPFGTSALLTVWIFIFFFVFAYIYLSLRTLGVGLILILLGVLIVATASMPSIAQIIQDKFHLDLDRLAAGFSVISLAIYFIMDEQRNNKKYSKLPDDINSGVKYDKVNSRDTIRNENKTHKFKNNISEALVLPICIVLVIALVGWSIPSSVSMADRIQTSITSAVLLVTAWYAYLTYQAVRVSREQSSLLTQSQYNAAVPVINLSVSQIISAEGSVLRISWQNVGKGPAINFRCWIEDEVFPILKTKPKSIWRTAIGVALDSNQDWSSIETNIPNYKLGLGYVRAQYESIFDHTYESTYTICENASPELKFGKAKEKVII